MEFRIGINIGDVVVEGDRLYGDAAVPFEEGRRMAARIPSDRFVALEGHNHLILEDEPAWPRFLQEVRAFLV